MLHKVVMGIKLRRLELHPKRSPEKLKDFKLERDIANLCLRKSILVIM